MIHFCADARMINNSGIGVYIHHYLKYILSQQCYRVTLLGRFVELNQYFGQYSNWDHIEVDIPIYSIKEQLQLPRHIPPCDVFWSPHYNIPLLPIKARKRIVTIPDVFHLAYKHTLSLPKRLYAQVVMQQAVAQSAIITTISDFSKQEIIKYTGCASNRVKTIHLGLNTALFHEIDDEVYKQQVRAKYQLPNQFILFVGNVKPNKNLASLVAALPTIIAQYPDVNLVIVGKKDGFITGDPALFRQIDASESLKGRVYFTGYVPFEELPVLYSLATVFAFPSLYEGFGFPPLEAMACGCPVVASNAASIPEICGKAAHYFDPVRPETLVNGLIDVLTNKVLRQDLIELGKQQFKQYSWESSATTFIEIINRL